MNKNNIKKHINSIYGVKANDYSKYVSLSFLLFLLNKDYNVIISKRRSGKDYVNKLKGESNG